MRFFACGSRPSLRQAQGKLLRTAGLRQKKEGEMRFFACGSRPSLRQAQGKLLRTAGLRYKEEEQVSV